MPTLGTSTASGSPYPAEGRPTGGVATTRSAGRTPGTSRIEPRPAGSTAEVYYVPASGNTAPRPGRRTVGIRLSWAGVAELDRMATAEGIDRSTLIRQLLAEAIKARRSRIT